MLFTVSTSTDVCPIPVVRCRTNRLDSHPTHSTYPCLASVYAFHFGEVIHELSLVDFHPFRRQNGTLSHRMRRGGGFLRVTEIGSIVREFPPNPPIISSSSGGLPWARSPASNPK